MFYQMGRTATLIFSLLVNFSLKQLWIFKNVMQVIVLLRILKQLPANLSSMLEALNDAVYFKLHYIIGVKVFCEYFAADEIEFTEVKSQYMQDWGIEDNSFFWSLGIFAIFFIVLVLLLSIYLLFKLYHFVSKRGTVGKSLTDYLHKKLFYSAICRYIIESYLKVVYNTVIFLTLDAGFTSGFQSTNTVVLYMILVFFLIWPFMTALFLKIN